MSDLANQIKTKYPQYANIDNAELEKRVVAKYPQYRSIVDNSTKQDYSVGGFAKNVLKSGVNTALGIGEGLVNSLNPDLSKNTIANVSRMAYGGLQKLDPTPDKSMANFVARTSPLGQIQNFDREAGRSTDYQPIAEGVGKFYGGRYGGIDNIKNTLYNDPVGAALDVSTVAGGGAGLAKMGGLGDVANVLGKVSRVTDPLQAMGKVSEITGLSRGVSNVGSKISGKLADLAETMPTRGMGNPALIGDARGMSPMPMNKLFEKYNLWGRTPEDFASGIKQSSGIMDEMSQKAQAVKYPINKAGTRIPKNNILGLLDSQISQLKEEAKYSTVAQTTLDELTKRRDTFARNFRSVDKIKPGTITNIKNLVQGDVPPSQFGLPASETAKVTAAKTFYKQLLNSLEENIPGTKGMGREQSAMYKLKEIAQNAQNRTMAAQPVKLKGLMTAGGGLAIGGIPGAIGGYFLNELLQSPAFLKTVTKGLEGASKAKIPTNIFKNAYSKGKVIRMFNKK